MSLDFSGEVGCCCLGAGGGWALAGLSAVGRDAWSCPLLLGIAIAPFVSAQRGFLVLETAIGMSRCLAIRL